MQGKDIVKTIEEVLLTAAKKYFQENLPEEKFPDNTYASLQLPRDSRHGDLTSNIAMRLSKAAKCSPAALGGAVISIFKEEIGRLGFSVFIGDVELKGGFINFRFSDVFYRELLETIHEQKENYGRSDDGRMEHVNLEFVSANPTGPLTIAHGRQAAIGGALSRILRFTGCRVTNEYYLNDYGRQINLLGKSVEIRYRNLFGNDEPMPEDGYMGGYINDIAVEIQKQKGDRLLKQGEDTSLFFREYAVEYMMKLIRKDLHDFGVSFDVWTSQAGIEQRDEVPETLRLIENAGYIYEEEGAKWFASTRFGDDKDRVVVKSDGAYTYLAPDIAYHNDKYRRGFTRLIDLLGPDHHGYIKRMKAAVQALGHDAGTLNILIVQLVTLMRGGETVSMSTRKGEFVSLRELLDELGKDVTRFFFLSRRLDSHLDFDIDLAKKESSDNPVYYIQYAHARICSIKKHSVEKGFDWPLREIPDLSLLKEPGEKQLMRKLAEFPFAVKSSAEALEPNRLIVYLNELARGFHSFYTEYKVVSEEEGISRARMYLVESVRYVLMNGLNLLDITLPERM
ncbi:MAG: arginine--tRNA ligase [Candidatus Omnitrophota bacterium]